MERSVLIGSHSSECHMLNTANGESLLEVLLASPHVYSIIARSDVSYVDSGAGQWLIEAHLDLVVATLSGELFGKFCGAVAGVGQYEEAPSC